MTGHAAACVEKYLELSGLQVKTLPKVTHPCIDDHQLTEVDYMPQPPGSSLNAFSFPVTTDQKLYGRSIISVATSPNGHKRMTNVFIVSLLSFTIIRNASNLDS